MSIETTGLPAMPLGRRGDACPSEVDRKIVFILPGFPEQTSGQLGSKLLAPEWRNLRSGSYR